MADRIAADPKVLAGKPVVRGTRISVSVILDSLAAGNSREDILREYPELTNDDISAAIEYASRILRGEVIDA